MNISKHKLGLLDESTGLVWYDEELKYYSHYEASELFNTPAKRLPTKEEFEFIKNYHKKFKFNDEYFYWSASLLLSSQPFAWDFNGYNGKFDNNTRSTIRAVKCVGHLDDIERSEHSNNFKNRLERLTK